MTPKKPSPTCVLVIDDDEMSRELLAALLEAEGYIVSSAESPDAAFHLLDSTGAPAVVLTDMQMPGSSPVQLAGRLRRACGRKTLLLAMSGSRPSEATIAHFDGFLLKPFNAADVTAAIRAPRAARPSSAVKPSSAAKRSTSGAVAAKPSTRIAKQGAALELAASASTPASKLRMGAESHAPSHPAAPAAAESLPALDDAIYRQLAGSMPAPQLREMYAMCVGDVRARIACMRALAAAHDAAQFMREAHAIKGSCGMLGATELHRRAAALEKRGPDPDNSGVNSLDELSSACDRLERMLGARA